MLNEFRLPMALKRPQLVRQFSAFIESEISWPHSQQPTTCSYPQPDAVHAPLSHYFNVILPPTPRSSKWSLPLRLPTETLFLHAPLLKPTRATCVAHLIHDVITLIFGGENRPRRRYELDGTAIESRWGARFSAPVQTCPGSHPASYTMGTALSWGYRGRGKALTTHTL
jgi:hypothetical protein